MLMSWSPEECRDQGETQGDRYSLCARLVEKPDRGCEELIGGQFRQDRRKGSVRGEVREAELEDQSSFWIYLKVLLTCQQM